MKLLFLFMSQSSASPGEITEWRSNDPCSSFYDRFKGECYFEMLRSLLDRKEISDLKIIYESNRGPGKASWIPGVHCEVMPHITFAEKYIDNDTILFVRGGFKNWLDWLMKYKGKNWIIIYAANTGRQRWPYWDIVLDDLEMKKPYLDGAERIWYPFIKPVNENFFFPQSSSLIPYYDVCIGSSHIHDKKGQWRMLEVAKAYKKLFDYDLRMVLPGSPKGGGLKTRAMFVDEYFQKTTWYPGYVNRTTLLDIFSDTKIYASLGTHGQNDRGPLEALAAGLPILLGSPRYHSPILREISCIPKDIDDYKEIAKVLHSMLDTWTPGIKKRLRDYYDCNCSFQIATDNFSKLLRLIKGRSPDLETKQNVIEILRGVNCG